MNTKIVIPPARKAILFKASDGRNNSKRPEASRHVGDARSQIVVNRIGILGEDATGTLIHLPIDLSYGAGGDGGVDMVTPGGRRIAVKYNHRLYNPWLMVTHWPGDTRDSLHDLKNVDVLVLAHGKCQPEREICQCAAVDANPDVPSEITVRGWLYKEEFMKAKKFQPKGKQWHNDLWYVEPSQLRKPDALVKLMAAHILKAEWDYHYEERLGVLCGNATPTDAQIGIATLEANAAVAQMKREIELLG